jgi:hypothetical protein
MNFIYKIENYYPLEDRVFVVYQAEGHEPLGGWVYVPETATSEEIVAAVEAAAPIKKWLKGENAVVADLLGQDMAGVVFAEVVPEPAPPAPAESAETASRRQRNSMLRTSDWTQLADSPIDETQRAAWAVYRQALRDITAQAGFPEHINWPTPPTL